MLALIGGNSASLAVPLFLGLVSDSIAKENWSDIGTYCLYMLCIVAFSAVCVGTRGATFNTMSQKIAQQIRYDFFFSIINKDIPFFDEVKTGDILSRMTSDTTVI